MLIEISNSLECSLLEFINVDWINLVTQLLISTENILAINIYEFVAVRLIVI